MLFRSEGPPHSKRSTLPKVSAYTTVRDLDGLHCGGGGLTPILCLRVVTPSYYALTFVHW